MTYAPAKCDISVVTCVYKSYRFLDEFLAKTLDALQRIGCSNFEIVFVIDGSPDDSLALLLKKKEEIPQIVIVELSRNFGHHYAAHAGLQYARGEYVFLIDCDLEVSPLILADFYQAMIAEACDVVYGYQTKRKGGWFESRGGGLFWRLFNMLSDTHVPPNIVVERLMRRKYVNALLELGDRNLFLGGMMYWVGFKQLGVPVAKGQRQGASTYTLRKRFALLVEAVTSFSAVPLRMLFYAGVVITGLAALYVTYLVAMRLMFPGSILLGFTSILAAIVLSLGMIMASIGVVGIYLSRIFRQVQNRPLFIVKNIYMHGEANAHPASASTERPHLVADTQRKLTLQ